MLSANMWSNLAFIRLPIRADIYVERHVCWWFHENIKAVMLRKYLVSIKLQQVMYVVHMILLLTTSIPSLNYADDISSNTLKDVYLISFELWRSSGPNSWHYCTHYNLILLQKSLGHLNICGRYHLKTMKVKKYSPEVITLF